MKRRPKSLLITLLLLPFMVWAAFSFVRSQSTPSEAELLVNFRQNRTAFNQLASMARADDLIWVTQNRGLTSKKVGKNEYKDLEIPKSRLVQYQTLMRRTRINLITYSSNRKICRFSAINGGALDTSWSIGYAWAKNPAIPMTIVPSAYYHTGQMRETTVYSPIEKDWYFFNLR